jgi:hypothetical protein
MLINLSSFNILSLVDLGSKHEINMQNGFSSNFLLPPCPHIPIGRHPLIELGGKQLFIFLELVVILKINHSFMSTKGIYQHLLPTTIHACTTHQIEGTKTFHTFQCGYKSYISM